MRQTRMPDGLFVSSLLVFVLATRWSVFVLVSLRPVRGRPRASCLSCCAAATVVCVCVFLCVRVCLCIYVAFCLPNCHLVAAMTRTAFDVFLLFARERLFRGMASGPVPAASRRACLDVRL